MNPTASPDEVRRRVRAVLAALEADDLEERLAPVKCMKHPDHPECSSDYGVLLYMAPDRPPEVPERDGG